MDPLERRLLEQTLQTRPTTAIWFDRSLSAIGVPIMAMAWFDAPMTCNSTAFSLRETWKLSECPLWLPSPRISDARITNRDICK